MSETQFPLDEAFMREYVELKRKVEDNALSAATTSIITGDLVASASPTRTGCLLCDGAAVSRATYAALFAVISTTFGVGDGSTTFNVPNYEGRALVGVGGGFALGTPQGAATVTLTGAESGTSAHTHPGGTTGAGSSHTHAGGTSGSNSVNHTHSIPVLVADYQVNAAAGAAISSIQNSGAGTAYNATRANTTGVESANHTHSIPTSGAEAAHTHSTPTVAASSAASASSAHNNLQPSLAAYIHVKT